MACTVYGRMEAPGRENCIGANAVLAMARSQRRFCGCAFSLKRLAPVGLRQASGAFSGSREWGVSPGRLHTLIFCFVGSLLHKQGRFCRQRSSVSLGWSNIIDWDRFLWRDSKRPTSYRCARQMASSVGVAYRVRASSLVELVQPADSRRGAST